MGDRDYTRGQKKFIKVKAVVFIMLVVVILFFPFFASLASEDGPALFWSIIFAFAVGFVIKSGMLKCAVHAWAVILAPLD